MRFLLSLLILLALAPVARAEDPHSAQDYSALPEVKMVEDYLNGLKTLKARFVQTDGEGQQKSGDFLLKRPGRLRFEYDPPSGDFIVADGLFVYYYDAEMKQQSNAPIGRSLADFFLRDKISLSGDLHVTDLKREDGLLNVTLAESADPLAGSLTLSFSENPLELKKWRIVDTQGAVTDVVLSDLKTGIKLDNEYFKYYDPAHTKPRYN